MNTKRIPGNGRMRAVERTIIGTYHTLHAEGHVSFSDDRALEALVERRPAKDVRETCVSFARGNLSRGALTVS